MRRNRINTLTQCIIFISFMNFMVKTGFNSVCSVVKNGFLCGCIDG